MEELYRIQTQFTDVLHRYENVRGVYTDSDGREIDNESFVAEKRVLGRELTIVVSVEEVIETKETSLFITTLIPGIIDTTLVYQALSDESFEIVELQREYPHKKGVDSMSVTRDSCPKFMTFMNRIAYPFSEITQRVQPHIETDDLAYRIQHNLTPYENFLPGFEIFDNSPN